MAKNSSYQPEENFKENLENSTVYNVDINKEVRNAFLDYSMSVIVSRALPDVRDGLKPVHRRILYTMFENNLTPDKAYRKCADTVGSVLGRYHPHGDASVYDAMVRLAQSFSMRYTLVDGHGNFGSIDGDPAAAYRYTESRMSKMALKMLTDIDKDTIDFTTNYDDRLKEPTVLPSRFPNILVNGSMGIAVGMATNIPPHNLSEVINGMCCVIDNPDASLEEIMEHIKGPDFPTYGIIMGRAGIRAAYATGRGKITVRARAEIIEKKNGRFEIKVTEIPYTVNKARLIESIADLVKDKKIEGISDINDYSSRAGMHISIDLKRDANPQVVLNQLYSFTQLQTTFGVIMLAIVNGVPKILTLKEVLQEYIQFQKEVVTRRTKYDLKKAQDRAHILEGLLTALDFIDEVIEILRASKNVNEGKEALMERFGLDEVQAQAIVQMRLGQLTGLERQKIEDELAELKKKIAEFLELLADETKILGVVKKEALEIADKYGDERRTQIENVSGEVDIEDLIPEETCVFTFTDFGYIKRIPMGEYQTQRRGGKGIKGLTRREDDIVKTMFTASTHSFVYFFTTKGRVFKLKGYEIPEGSRNSKGMNIINLLPLEADEKISSMKCSNSDEEYKYICMFTRNGIIKRSAVTEYGNIRKSGVIAINLDDDDELAWVAFTKGNDDIIVATKKGMSIRFNENDARPIGRTARGVKAMELKDGDEVIGMAVADESKAILTVSETGYGRISNFDDYRIQSRGGKGLINYHVEKYGDVAAVAEVSNDEDLILIASDGIIIRIPVDGISMFNRPSKGVRVMRVTEGERLVTMVAVPHEEEEETSENVTTEEDENSSDTVTKDE